MNKAGVVLIGYSGHAYVVYDCITSMGSKVAGYCEANEKSSNPFKLKYFGYEKEKNVLAQLKSHSYFVAIGDNAIRGKAYRFLVQEIGFAPIAAVHASAVISTSSKIAEGVLVAPNAIINAMAIIGEGAICNSSCIIEHECIIGKFSHIAPGATLCGNVKVGEGSFVGANSVVKEGITIGKGATIGAGTVVIENIPDHAVVAGNPQRTIRK